VDPRTVKRILVPTDFSEPAAEALTTAIAFAQLSGATLDLIHVAVEASYVLPPPVDVATVPVDMAQIMTRVAEELTTEEARAKAAGAKTESATLVGRPDTEIVTRAKETGAELIIMGTHGRSGLAHVLLGSVAERVTKHAPCPVLIIRKHRDKT
jgi:universal stress protein A